MKQVVNLTHIGTKNRIKRKLCSTANRKVMFDNFDLSITEILQFIHVV